MRSTASLLVLPVLARVASAYYLDEYDLVARDPNAEPDWDELELYTRDADPDAYADADAEAALFRRVTERPIRGAPIGGLHGPNRYWTFQNTRIPRLC